MINGFLFDIYMAHYQNIEQFLSNPPTKGVIGTFIYDSDTLELSKISLTGYEPKKTDTITNIPLRGKHTFYAYYKWGTL